MPQISEILKSTYLIHLHLCLVVLIGDSNVGKTALVNRLVNDRPPLGVKCPTIGVEFAKLAVWDRIQNVAV